MHLFFDLNGDFGMIKIQDMHDTVIQPDFHAITRNKSAVCGPLEICHKKGRCVLTLTKIVKNGNRGYEGSEGESEGANYVGEICLKLNNK